MSPRHVDTYAPVDKRAYAVCANCPWGSPARRGRAGVDNVRQKARHHARNYGHTVTVVEAKISHYTTNGNNT